MTDLKFKLSFDDRGRVNYQPGDIVGVVGKGIIPWLSKNAIVPQTDLFHFLLIGDRVGTKDYEVLESIGKGVAVGRLSWYKDRRYIVFRVNHEDSECMGTAAFVAASVFGRRKYDWKLYARIFAWALGYWLKEIATFHIPPLPVYPNMIPYKTDQDFVCIELVFEAWKQVGFRIREHGHAPVPAEIILAQERGDLKRIDSHDGNLANWQEHKSPLYMVGRKIIDERPKAGPDIIGRQRGQKRNRVHIFRQPYGYPIRLCDWALQDIDSIERIGEVEGTRGPVEAARLVMALDLMDTTKGTRVCKHCRATVKGKRGPLMGEPK